MKSLTERYEDEGLVGFIAPNKIAKTIELNIPDFGVVSCPVELDQDGDPGKTEIRIPIGMRIVRVRGSFLLSSSSEEIVERICSDDFWGRLIAEAIDAFKEAYPEELKQELKPKPKPKLKKSR